MTQPPGADDERTLKPDGNPAPGPAHSHETALPAATRLGEFEIVGLIGIGGFGIVYLAQDHSLDRKVALKEYMPSALAQRDADGRTVRVSAARHADTFAAGLRSFINEARLLAQFDHPSLVKVYRFWEANGTAYMVMPYYEGETLKDTLKNMQAPPDEGWLTALLAQLLDALEIIHARQCYHRDIAPDNILMLSGDTPLLLDFGAARRVIGDMTQALTVILKPGYAPIEQYAEAPNMRQGPWTDLYALASVVYFAVLGKPPVAAVARVMSDPLPPLAKAAHGRYSEGFLEAIDAALAVRPEDRPQDVAAFREALGIPPREPVTRYVTTMGEPMRSAASVLSVTGARAQPQLPPDEVAAPMKKPLEIRPQARRRRYARAGIVTGVVLLASAAALYYLTRGVPGLTDEKPQALSAEVDPIEVIESALTGFQCAHLRAQRKGETALVHGHVATESDLARLRTELAAKGAAVDATSVRVIPRPYCSVVGALAPYTARSDGSEGAQIALAGGASRAIEGEMLRVEVVAPGFESYVYADLYDPQSNVVHLLPNAQRSNNRLPPGERLVLGNDPLGGAQWEIVPPLGKHLLVVMAADTPLFERERPQVEDVFGYLRAVRDGASARPDTRLVVGYALIEFAVAGQTASPAR